MTGSTRMGRRIGEAVASRLGSTILELGGNNAIILDDDGVASGELRFADEFVRHKVGDLIGDLGLLGGRLCGHVVAERPSHAGNVEIGRQIVASVERLVRAKPDAKPRIAQLLGIVESLIGD